MSNFLVKFREIELKILNNVSKKFTPEYFCGGVDEDYVNLINHLLTGQYQSFIENPLVKNLLKFKIISEDDATSANFDSILPNQLGDELVKNIAQYIAGEEEDVMISENEKIWRHFVILSLAVSLLHLFLQQNWVGPPITNCPLLGSDAKRIMKMDEQMKTHFCVNGEHVNECSSHLVYLFFANLILVRFEEELSRYFS
ncbi:hypothetical protein HELRODRAFT_184586, partial [Helobdella robusta]|uniref:Uncharacterized protein n=1 Tax=Helobdella robusta TaxID=6412 RepID=T1FLJ3_HELRO